MKNQVLTIGQTELIELLNNVEKSTFVNIVMETPVRMNKTGNPYFNLITKRSKTNFLIGNDYETRVNSNEKKEGLEGDFVSMAPSGKKHISKCVLVDTKTESTHYLMVERFDEIKPTTEFIFEGNEIDKQLFESYMVKVSETSRQDQEKKVMVITPKIENIKELSLNGTRYIVEG
jgi:hypothetical protein